MATTGDPAPLILSPEEIAYLALKKGGIRAATVATAVAIALAESGGNVYAHNARGLDDSYGLWQINMKGDLGPARRKQFNLATNEDLFRATANALAMAAISNGGDNWRPWTTFTGGAYIAQMVRAKPAADKVVGAWNNNENIEQYNPEPRLVQSDQQRSTASGSVLDKLFSWVTSMMLRVAGFVGGGVLVVLAIVLYVRSKS